MGRLTFNQKDLSNHVHNKANYRLTGMYKMTKRAVNKVIIIA